VSGYDFAILMAISIATTMALWWAITSTIREVGRWREYQRYSPGVLALTSLFLIVPWALGIGLLLLDFYVGRNIL